MNRWVRADRADLYALVFIAAASVVLAIQPLSWLVTGMVIDDALYYPKIALSVADGSGFTYDGQTETNGIHPLWQIVWLPLALIADGDANLLLRLGFLLSATIMAVGFFVLSRVLRRVGVGPVISAFILAGLFFARADLFMSLMESVLVFLMVGLALIVSLRAPETSRELLRQRVILGIVLGAMCLSRLDTVFIVPGLAIATAYAWGAKSPRTWLLHQVTTGAAFMAVVVPYLLWNVIRFGNLLPVSGIKKMRTSDTTLDSIFGQNALFALPEATIGKLPGPDAGWWIIGGLGAALIALALARTYRRSEGSIRNPAPSAVILAGFTVAVVIRYVFLGVMLPGEVVPWYLVPDYVLYSLLAAVGVSVVARASPYRLPSPGLAVIPVLVLVLIAGSFNIRRDAELVKNTNIILRDAGLWARENLPPDSTAAMYDSGYFSYFSEIDTVSLNGLVTDFDTMTQLVDGDRSGVIQRLGVEYLVLLVQEDVENVIPGNKVVYTSRVFPSGSSSPGAKLFIIGPLDDETIRLLD